MTTERTILPMIKLGDEIFIAHKEIMSVWKEDSNLLDSVLLACTHIRHGHGKQYNEQIDYSLDHFSIDTINACVTKMCKSHSTLFQLRNKIPEMILLTFPGVKLEDYIDESYSITLDCNEKLIVVSVYIITPYGLLESYDEGSDSFYFSVTELELAFNIDWFKVFDKQTAMVNPTYSDEWYLVSVSTVINWLKNTFYTDDVTFDIDDDEEYLLKKFYADIKDCNIDISDYTNQ